MIKNIILLSPVFVSLFWALTLIGSNRNSGRGQLFLSSIMLVACLAFVLQFLHYSQFPKVYPCFDPISVLVGLLLFPLFHIYFRLRIPIENFSWRIHAWILYVPTGIGLVYLTIVMLTPKDLYRFWLYNEIDWSLASAAIIPLKLAGEIVRITFLTQLVTVITSNFLLIRKIRKNPKSVNSYQEIDGPGMRRLNFYAQIMGIAFVATVFSGFSAHLPQNVLISIVWLVFSFGFFMIGLSGVQQKLTKPYFKTQSTGKDFIQFVKPSGMQTVFSAKVPKDQIMNRIIYEFEQKKIYLNSSMGIMDVARSIGSNRTYIAAIIKENFGLNFCGYVNSFRLKELERILIEDSKMTTEKIAESCGFGTVNSMKRAVFSRTGLSFHEYRQQFNGNGPEI